jgi:type VI secretion system secreted protein VgrG
MTAAYTQANRALMVSTPLGGDALLLDSFSAVETMSEPFSIRLDLLALPTTPVPFEKLLTQPITVAVTPPDGSPQRFFHGLVTRFGQGRQARGIEGTVQLIRYFAELRPAFWLLSRRVRSRIFQSMSVPDILKDVLTGTEVSFRLEGKYEPREYCVQYRESDFAFASRLMEDEGIHYYFVFTARSHQMIIADTPGGHGTIAGKSTLPYKPSGGGGADPIIASWEKVQELRSNRVVLWDYSFQTPDKNLEAQHGLPTQMMAGTIKHQLAVGTSDKFETFDDPGGYAHRFDDTAPNGSAQPDRLRHLFSDNTRMATLRAEQEAAGALTLNGTGSCRHFTAGHGFTLSDHFNGNGPYTLTQVEHNGSQAGSYTTEGGRGLEYRNSFRCIPAALPFRPQRHTAQPQIDGFLTARVVAPAAPPGTTPPEIATDKYGRIKVQFHWERDKKPSCWVRVATAWAGQGWGLTHIPRVGQEVIVAFEDGHPDRPLVVGCVPNAQHLPPYPLPEQRTTSGLKSRSSPGGGPENYNELRFEDQKDAERVHLQAERDFTRLVKHDETAEIRGHRSEVLTQGNETLTLDKGSRAHKIAADDTLEIGGDQTIKVTGDSVTLVGGTHSVIAAGGSTINYVSGDYGIVLQNGTFSVDVGVGNRITVNPHGALSLTATAAPTGSIALVASQGVELRVGANVLAINRAGITLKAAGNTIHLGAAGVEVHSPGVVSMDAPMMQFNSGGATGSQPDPAISKAATAELPPAPKMDAFFEKDPLGQKLKDDVQAKQTAASPPKPADKKPTKAAPVKPTPSKSPQATIQQQQQTGRELRRKKLEQTEQETLAATTGPELEKQRREAIEQVKKKVQSGSTPDGAVQRTADQDVTQTSAPRTNRERLERERLERERLNRRPPR